MQQLVDDGGLRLAGCVPQPPDPVAAEKLGWASARSRLAAQLWRGPGPRHLEIQ